MRRGAPLAVVVAALSLAACTSGGAPGGAASASPPEPSALVPSPGPSASPSGSPAASGSAVVSASPATSAAASPVPSGDPEPSSPGASAGPLAWSRLDLPGGPGAREDHTWTVEAAAGAAWLFGGRDGSDAFGDLWRFDLAAGTWEHVEPGAGPAPAARFGHTATWVDGVGLVVWAGQADATTFFDDLWAFEPAGRRWRELSTGGDVPPARYGSCAALGPDGRLWVSHGFTADAGRFADTWAFDFRAGRWVDETPTGDVPVVRCLHDCLWTPDGRFLLYAGQTTGVPAIGDLWSRTAGAGWVRGGEGEPPARQLYALAAERGRAWVYGGGGRDRGKLGDLWTLDLASLAWSEAEPEGEAPAARSGATLVADPAANRLLLFGGLTERGASAEGWALSLGG